MACTCIALYQVWGLESTLHDNQSLTHSYTHSRTDAGELHCFYSCPGADRQKQGCHTFATTKVSDQ